MSFTKSVITLSKVGSAPLFARKNLPSLDDVPCSSLAKVTAWSCILVVSTAFDCKLPAPTALLASFAFVTAPPPN